MMTNAPAAAKLLKAREAELQGTVVLIFQPAEEGGAGAKFMLEEGALKGVDAIHGVHVMPIFKSGIITSKVRHHFCEGFKFLKAVTLTFSFCIARNSLFCIT